jgi:hypothetical protein
MKRTLMVFLSLCCFIGGLGFYAISKQWLIIHYPRQTQVVRNETVEKKKVWLWYWHQEKWKSEQVDLIWSSHKAKTIKYLIDSWLNLLDEEKITSKKVSLQTALLSPSEQDVYLSFDRNPFTKEQATIDKWFWIEGLLKTIRDNGISLQGVYFLVHHQPLHDYHLDFSNAWPALGFLIKR